MDSSDFTRLDYKTINVFFPKRTIVHIGSRTGSG